MSQSKESSSTNVVLEIDNKEKLNTSFELINNSLVQFKQLFSNLQTQFKELEKNTKKELKVLKKEADKNKNKGNRKPSGFATPRKVSSELCKFMNVPEGTEIARTEVTQYLIKYIKENSLQHTENKKKINPNEALKTLLGVSNNEEVDYFNLQRLMNRHFIAKNAITSSN